MANIEQLARENVRQMTPYQSARRLGGQGHIWLNANEYYQSPPLTIGDVALNRYPEAQPQQLIARYAAYAGVTPDQVLVSRGGDESIELVIRAFCADGDAVLYCPPTYGMYAVSAETCGVPCKRVPLRDDFQLDIPAIAAQLDGVKVVFICSPNNPTGTLLRREDIRRLLEMTQGRAVVVVDEAYIEFCRQDSVVSLLAEYPHLAIVRTLSKAFALAGLRCGFTLAQAEMIRILQKVIAPYPIPVPVSALACQALTEDGIAVMQQRVDEVIAQREDVIQALTACPSVQAVYPSAANYVLFRAQQGDALFRALWTQGIILRHQGSQPMLADCIRMTIGSADENHATLDAIRAFFTQYTG